MLPCLRHVDTIIRMFWAKVKQVDTFITLFTLSHNKNIYFVLGGTYINEQVTDRNVGVLDSKLLIQSRIRRTIQQKNCSMKSLE